MNTPLLSTFCSPAKKSNTNLLFTCLVLVFMVLGNVNAQVSSYLYNGTTTATDATAAYTILSGTAGSTALWGPTSSPLVTAWDNNVLPAPIGFTFNFNGTNYTSVNVSTNGFITFGTAPAVNNFNPLTGTGIYAGAIAAYGRDLINNAGATRITYLSTGGVFTIEWVGLRSGAAGTIYTQIKLYETTNVIEVRHRTPTAYVATVIYGEIGLRGATNADVNSLNWQPTTFPANWPTTPPVLPNNTAGPNTDRVMTRGNSGSPTTQQAYNTLDTKFTWTGTTCFAPSGVTVPQISLTHNTAVVDWNASASASNGYQWEIRTSNPPGSGAAGLAASNSTLGLTTGTVSGLTASTTYYVYVRSDCGAGFSAWSPVVSFTTRCTPYAVNPPWIQDFSIPTPPAIPNCNYTETLNTIVLNNYWVTSNATAPTWGFANRHLRILVAGGVNNNATYYTEGLTLDPSKRYRLSYKYGGSTNSSSSNQNLVVRIGTAPLSAAMGDTLAHHPLFRGGPYTNIVNFRPVGTSTKYIGFKDYTLANNETTLLDDIDIRESVCKEPTGVAISGITSGGATISWTAAVPLPGNGYFYYVSSNPTPPIGDAIPPQIPTTPTGSVPAGVTTATIAGLLPLTNYCVWVMANCGNGDHSEWTPVAVCFTTTAGSTPAACNPSGGGFAQDPEGITNVTFGTINNTTGIETNNYGNYASLVTSVAQSTSVPVKITFRTGYTYYTKIWIDWNQDGTFTDAAPELVASGNSTNGVPTTLTLPMTIPGSPTTTIGTQYRMRIGSHDDPIFTGGALTPCRTGAYQAFEDYSVYVTAAPPPITLSAFSPSNTICSGSSATLNVTSPVANYTTYTWSPTLGVSGTPSLYTFNPTVTTTYTLTGVNSATFQTTSVSVTVIVKPIPTSVTVTPATATICEGGTTTVPLTITPTSGIIAGIQIYNETFNGTAPGWLTTNTTTGPNGAAAVWALQPDGYNPFFQGDIHSNDNSQFVFAESDAPGPGIPNPTTNTTLTSPGINLTGYTSASLSFWHYYKYYPANNPGVEQGAVQISNSPTGPFTNLITPFGASDVGAPNGFVEQVIDLTPYISMGTVYIRFSYIAYWDWGWAVDNVKVTGSGISTITWLPITGLYTNAAGTIPYTTGSNASTVYALPSITTTYTATAASNGCSSTGNNSATVTVTPLNATAAPSSQTVCSGVVAPITLSPLNGTVAQWQYSNSNSPYTWVNMPLSTGATLSSTEIGFLTATRYFRAQLSGCGTNYSNIVTVTVNASVYNGTWSNGAPTTATINKMFVYDASATIAAGVSACSVFVRNGTVTVNSGVTLTVENGVSVDNAARLIFLDDASLVQIQNTANTGDITYNRITPPVRLFDYTTWSSPVSSQRLTPFSPATQPDKFYIFNTAAGTVGEWQNPGTWPFTTTPMIVGKGYLIRAPNTNPEVSGIPFNGVFGYPGTGPHVNDGVPNNGDIVIPVVRVDAAHDLNCLGNPYPSAISANLLVSGNNAAGQPFNGGTTFYFWTHNTQISGQQYTDDDYASYNSTGGSGTGSIALTGGAIPTGNIAAGQGFMVRAKANGNVTFRNTMRLAGLNTQFFRMDGQLSTDTELERHRLWLEMYDTAGHYKQALVGYVQDATNGYDGDFDGELLESGNPISLYSVLDDSKLTIQGRSLPFADTDLVPLGYRTTVAGTFEINLGQMDGLFLDSQDVYLEDTVLNVIHDLKQGSYSFVTEPGTFNTRFVLRYTSSALGTDASLFNENGVVVYKNNDVIYIKTSNITMDAVKIFDTRGRQIFERKNINGTQTEISNLNAAQQVLLIQITSMDNVMVSKKIVF